MSEPNHAPPHVFTPGANYIITGATLYKEHLFRSSTALNFLRDTVLSIFKEARWSLDAWSIFSNHYHVVGGASDVPHSDIVQQIHGSTSRRIGALPARNVWYQFWDTELTFQKSYLARLRYVHYNPIKHGLVRDATDYPRCSAREFEGTASPGRIRTIKSFGIDRANVNDDFEPVLDTE